jgi:hypothetical protein
MLRTVLAPAVPCVGGLALKAVVRTTDWAHPHPVTPNALNRQFGVERWANRIGYQGSHL